MPLFQNYLLHEVLPFSLVGKIGLLGETEELYQAQELLKNLEKIYSPTPTQKAIKAFSFPFHYRSKACSLIRQLLTHLSRKSFLTNTVLKQELRYFKDANVDTLIPLNYCIFNGERTIKKFLNFKKIRFHGLSTLERSFKKLVSEERSSYKINIYATDSKDSFLSEKKWIWILQKGKTVDLNWIDK